MDITSGAELARALKENDWVTSKSTDKTIAVMSGLAAIPWNKVKMLKLAWELIGGEIVPTLNIMMHEPGPFTPPKGMTVEGSGPGPKPK